MDLLAQNDGGGVAAGFLIVVYIAVIAFVIAGMWKTFAKAGQPGWTAIIPILNLLVLIRIAGREWWWLLLMLIPCVSIVIFAIVAFDVARRFGRTTAFGVGLWLLSPIFLLILGFGDSEFQEQPDPIF